MSRHELSVCPDCIHVAASGPPDYAGYGDTGHAQRYGNGLAYFNGGEPYSDDGAPSFSWGPCDYCGDELGGDRYAAIVIERGATR